MMSQRKCCKCVLKTKEVVVVCARYDVEFRLRGRSGAERPSPRHARPHYGVLMMVLTGKCEVGIRVFSSPDAHAMNTSDK